MAHLPESVPLGSGLEIPCPHCHEPAALLWDGSRVASAFLGHHRQKLYISKTQYVEMDCPLGGQSVKDERWDEDASSEAA